MDTVRTLWSEYVVRGATGYELGRFDTRAEADACLRRNLKGGFFIDRIDTLDARNPDTGDLITIAFAV